MFDAEEGKKRDAFPGDIVLRYLGTLLGKSIAMTQQTQPKLAERMKDIKHTILVLSGKGGVGKSTVSAQIAFSLIKAGKKVGILDIDLCGPSIPRLVGLVGKDVKKCSDGYAKINRCF